LIPIEEIISNINEMGYITPTPKDVKPSYYKLDDGTILKVIVNINYILPNHLQKNNFSINSTNLISTFVPQEKRRPDLFNPIIQVDITKDIRDEDVSFEVLLEEFSIYELSNGSTLSLKSVLSQVQKTKYYNNDGEPVYNVFINPILKIKNTKL